MPVKDWFRGFWSTHKARYPSPDPSGWGDVGTDEERVVQSDFFKGLCSINAQESEALLASEQLLDEPKMRYREHHRRLLLEKIGENRKAALGYDKHFPAAEREDAAARSRDCPECDGQGLSIRRNANGLPFELILRSGRRVEVPEVVLSCVCPLGQWMRVKAGAERAPWPDLGSGGWLRLTVRAEGPRGTVTPPVPAAVSAVSSGSGAVPGPSRASGRWVAPDLRYGDFDDEYA